MIPVRTRLLPAAGALAGVALAAGVPLPVPLAVLALACVTLVAPGACVVAWLASGRPAPERRALALALAPALWGGAVTALVWGGGLALAPASRAAAGVLAVVGAWTAWRARPSGVPDDDAGSTRAAMLAALGWAALCGGLLAWNHWLPLRSDGWFHAGVARQILLHGVPPEDPYFAGLRLLYFWGYHVWVASWWALVPELGVRVPLVAFQTAAAAAVVLAVAAAVRPFARGARAAWVAAGLTVAGYAPGAWAWLLPRTMLGEVRGWPELRRVVTGGVESMSGVMATGLLHPSLVFFGDKYLLPTPFGMGLALFALGVPAMLRQAGRPVRHEVPVLAAVIAAALFTHAVIGDALLLLLALVTAATVPAALRDGAARRHAAGLVAAGAAGLLLVLPYVLEITLGKRAEQASFGTRPLSWSTFLLSGAALVPLGIAGLWRERHRPDVRGLAWLGAVLAALSLLLRLHEDNQIKFLNLLELLLVAPATAAALASWDRADRRGRRWLAGLAGLAIVPGFLLSYASYAIERGATPMAWHEPDAAQRAALDWARRELPPDAVLADLAGAQDLFVFSDRSVIWGGTPGERDWGYPRIEIEARREAVRDLVAGRAPTGEARRMLDRLSRPVVVVARGPAQGDSIYSAGQGFRRLFRNDAIGWYGWSAP